MTRKQRGSHPAPSDNAPWWELLLMGHLCNRRPIRISSHTAACCSPGGAGGASESHTLPLLSMQQTWLPDVLLAVAPRLHIHFLLEMGTFWAVRFIGSLLANPKSNLSDCTQVQFWDCYYRDLQAFLVGTSLCTSIEDSEVTSCGSAYCHVGDQKCHVVQCCNYIK